MYEQNIVSIQEKGNRGESALTLWFQENEFAFLQITQDPASYANVFDNNEVKRPDYLVALDSIGFLAVDAKNCKLYNNKFFTLGCSEVTKALAFEQFTRTPFWFAFYYQHNNDLVWYWISAMQTSAKGVACYNFKTEENFLTIHISNFIPVC